MNYYFLLEDEKSLLKVLPKWLIYMGFNNERVEDIESVTHNTYVLQSGQGVTQLITKVLFDTIDTILEKQDKHRVDKLIIILDTEDLTKEEREKQVRDAIKEKYEIEAFDFEILIFVCNHCFESWLLGKIGLYPEAVTENQEFYPFYKHYNIKENDPENMIKPNDWESTIAKYHFNYFSALCRYHKIRYTKRKPNYVSTEDYFEGLLQRISVTNDLKSLKSFVEYIRNEVELQLNSNIIKE